MRRAHTAVEVLRALPELALGLAEAFLAAPAFLAAGVLAAALVVVFLGATFLVAAAGLVAVFCVNSERGGENGSGGSGLPWQQWS